MKKRFAFIDLHKGWSLILMIETHIFNAMLQPVLKESGWFGALNFVNGLIAPSFIFISGFAFIIASRRKIDEFRKFKFQFWRQIGRILLILIAGYLLHMPHLSLSTMQQKSSLPEVTNFLKVDVLQCIAVSLLFLFILRLIIKRDKVYNYALAVSLVIVLLISPLFWEADFADYMPLFFSNYLNTMHGSLFPLFPWAGFMIAGALCGTVFIYARETNIEKELIKYSFIFSGLLAVISGILLTPGLLPEVKPNPVFFFMRVSLILLLLIFFWYYEYYRKTEKSFVLDISHESLLVYWLHLQIIYRRYWNGESLNSVINTRLNVLEALLATIILISIMFLIAKLWSAVKGNYPLPARIIVIISAVTVCLIFILN